MPCLLLGQELLFSLYMSCVFEVFIQTFHILEQLSLMAILFIYPTFHLFINPSLPLFYFFNFIHYFISSSIINIVQLLLFMVTFSLHQSLLFLFFLAFSCNYLSIICSVCSLFSFVTLYYLLFCFIFVMDYYTIYL